MPSPRPIFSMRSSIAGLAKNFRSNSLKDNRRLGTKSHIRDQSRQLRERRDDVVGTTWQALATLDVPIAPHGAHAEIRCGVRCQRSELVAEHVSALRRRRRVTEQRDPVSGVTICLARLI